MTAASAGMGSSTRQTRDGLDVQISDVGERTRFEATVDGELAAFAQYKLRGDHVDFVHTLTESGWEGRGIASVLAEAALDLVREADRRAIPHCPFISAYIHRHTEYTDLVDERDRRLIRPSS